MRTQESVIVCVCVCACGRTFCVIETKMREQNQEVNDTEDLSSLGECALDKFTALLRAATS